MRIPVLLFALFALYAPAGSADAHALEPGYLEISPISENEWRVTWRKPQVAGQPMGIDAESGKILMFYVVLASMSPAARTRSAL